MISPTKKSFLFTFCLLLLSPQLIAMKRRGTEKRHTAKRQGTARTTTALIPAVLQEQTCPSLPGDLWISIALEDLSNLYNLRQTCSTINTALQTITYDYLKNSIIANPKIAKEIARNFYVCTNLLFDYGKQLNEPAFNALWNNQPISDKGFRTHFVKTLTNPIKGREVTPLQVFNVEAISPCCEQDNNAYIPTDLFDFLHTALTQKSPQRVQLASVFFLYDKTTLDQINKAFGEFNMRLHDKPLLRHACQHSTAQCLKIVLDYDIIDQDVEANMKKECALHLILTSLTDHYIDERAKKIEYILNYYDKKRANNEEFSQQYNIVNHRSQQGTPLSYAITLFSRRRISLNELLDIIKTLLKYGADPQKTIFEDCFLYNNYTVFAQIAKETQSKFLCQFITPEEADVIEKLLKTKC